MSFACRTGIQKPLIPVFRKNQFVQASGSSSTASLSFNSDGTVTAVGNYRLSPSIPADFWAQGLTASDWEIKLVQTSGTSPSTGPALDTWHALTTTRTWTMTANGLITRTGVFAIHFKKAGATDTDAIYTALSFTAYGIPP